MPCPTYVSPPAATRTTPRASPFAARSVHQEIWAAAHVLRGFRLCGSRVCQGSQVASESTQSQPKHTPARPARPLAPKPPGRACCLCVPSRAVAPPPVARVGVSNGASSRSPRLEEPRRACRPVPRARRASSATRALHATPRQPAALLLRLRPARASRGSAAAAPREAKRRARLYGRTMGKGADARRNEPAGIDRDPQITRSSNAARVAIAQTRRGPLALAALMTGARVHRRGGTPLAGERTALLAQGSATLRTRTCPPPQRRSGGRLARPRDRRAAGAGVGTAAAAAGRGARPLSLSPIRSRLQPPSTRPPPVCARGLHSSLA